MQITGGSSSLKGWGNHFQKVGATGREMLISASKTYWKLNSQPIVRDGFVYHPSNNEKKHFGFFAQKAQKLIIDRTFIADNTRWIIDYKSTAVTTNHHEFAQQQKERHRPQLELYAQALSQTEQLPIKLGLYFPDGELWLHWDYHQSILTT